MEAHQEHLDPDYDPDYDGDALPDEIEELQPELVATNEGTSTDKVKRQYWVVKVRSM